MKHRNLFIGVSIPVLQRGCQVTQILAMTPLNQVGIPSEEYTSSAEEMPLDKSKSGILEKLAMLLQVKILSLFKKLNV